MLSGDAAAATASSSLSNECVNKKWKLEKFLLLFFIIERKSDVAGIIFKMYFIVKNV